MLTRINNKKVIPVHGIEDTRPVRGGDLIPECFSNIFLCAKKKSGKTSVIFTLLKHCVGKNTSIIAFVSTLHKDPSWIKIQEYFEDKGVPFVGATSLNEDGVDQLSELVNELQKQDTPKEPGVKETKAFDRLMTFEELSNTESADFSRSASSETPSKKPRKSKLLEPEYIIVLDDLSNELKSKSLVTLLKKNRHFKAKIIISSQYLNDLLPESRKQIDVWILFKSQPVDKLKEIYKDADLSIPFDKFLELYENATSENFHFLYIDARKEQFRKDFSHAYVVQP